MPATHRVHFLLLIDRLIEVSPVVVVFRNRALDGKIRVGISDEGLAGEGRVASGCERCDEKVRRAIVEYNKTRDIEVFDGLDCECRKK